MKIAAVGNVNHRDCAFHPVQPDTDRAGTMVKHINRFVNEQIERNHLDMPLRPTEYKGNEETIDKILTEMEKARQNTLVPYMKKMGNCQLILVPGQHLIYTQKPEKCGEMIQKLIDSLKK